MSMKNVVRIAAQYICNDVSLTSRHGKTMKIQSLYLVGAFAFLLATPVSAFAQDADALPLAVGDTVQFSIDPGEDFFGEWVGTVRELRNPHGCVFIVHSKIVRGDIFSMGVRFPDDFELTKHSSAGPTIIDAAMLRRHGIDCIETHPTADPTYLTPTSDADRAQDQL